MSSAIELTPSVIETLSEHIKSGKLDPVGPLDPIDQCFRCGYIVSSEIADEGYIIPLPPNDEVSGIIDNIMRYGPSFQKNFTFKSAIKPERIKGLPVKCCSIECCLDILSKIYEEDLESFTICCCLVSKMYNVRIPGLPIVINGPQIPMKNLNKDIKLLKRWGGSQTYHQYRSGLTMVPYKMDIPDEPVFTGSYMEDLVALEAEKNISDSEDE